MILTVDIMGGDNPPKEIIHGVVKAAHDFGITIQLVGKPEIIEDALSEHKTDGLNLPIIPAYEVITMDDSPIEAVRTKTNASLNVGIQQLKMGTSQGFVSTGNSGGVLASALFNLGRIKGIKRPALSTIFPSKSKSGFCFILDVGANTEVKPEYCYQFALMGVVYCERVLNIANPKVGWLSIGNQKNNENQLEKETIPLLKNGPFDFIGTIKGNEIATGIADVIVTDGFTGNIVLKTAEGTSRYIMDFIKDEVSKSPVAKLGALFAKGSFRKMKKKIDPREIGAGALLGVNGIVLIAHGNSDAHAIYHAIRSTKRAVENKIIDAFKNFECSLTN